MTGCSGTVSLFTAEDPVSSASIPKPRLFPQQQTFNGHPFGLEVDKPMYTM